MGMLKYLYFTLALLFYISVILANTVVIAIIYSHQNLHEPMYLFLCSLFINEIYGSTSMLPCLMAQVLTASLVHDLVFGLIISVAGPVSYITYSYIKILQVCIKGSKETKAKALDTCTPHLVSIISFMVACFISLITQRFDMFTVPYPLCVVLSMYVVIIQPLQNPVMYGLKLSKIRQAGKDLFALKTIELYVEGRAE
ncbi:olfactory receptor 52B2-like [Echeneis naucrates]|uniref:olfactory receptor 52B2-like n=1 Tax=Echeneis naucrates TaxID=173247 RepID=UPI0011141B28|nr:olfactory receptor 52B2-like [Echeneis naucrates]